MVATCQASFGLTPGQQDGRGRVSPVHPIISGCVYWPRRLLLTLTLLPPLAASASSGLEQVPQPFPKPSSTNGGSTSSSAPPPRAPRRRRPRPRRRPPRRPQLPRPRPQPAPAPRRLERRRRRCWARRFITGAQFLALVRRGAGPALLPVWHHRQLRGGGGLLSDGAEVSAAISCSRSPPRTCSRSGASGKKPWRFPPGVTVKDYMSGNLAGLPEPASRARQPARFPTVDSDGAGASDRK